MVRLLPLVALSLVASSASLAGETPWQDLAPDVRMRMISAGTVTVDGKAQMALELAMPASTKTYWRVPGDTGLPTQIDLAGSEGAEDLTIHWPYPARDEQPDYLDYVYFGDVVLPFSVDVSNPSGHVLASVTLGICSEICIPAQAKFSLPLEDGQPDRANALRIRQALATVPLEAPPEEDPIGVVEILSEPKSIGVWISDQDFDATSLIAALENGFPVIGSPQKSPQSNLVKLPIHGKTDNSDLKGRVVHLTYMTASGAFEVKRTIGEDLDGKVTASGQ